MLRAILLLLSLVLLVALLALWVNTKGQVRHVHWTQPEPKSLDVAGMLTPLPVRTVEQGQFLETLERPLFSPSRRPPPPPPPPAPPEEAAPPLTGVHVYGLYGADNQGGAILRVDGKNQRVAVNQSVKGWRLASIGSNSLTFRRGSRQHVLELRHYIPGTDKGASAAPASAPPANSRATTRARAPAAAVPGAAQTPP
ncbi:MAG TPA: hypothetical protein PK925_04070 [Alicycliphilus sp.]|nr:hypothetical protein [Alicycliphilus sp.]